MANPERKSEEATGNRPAPVVIKKYANRRLYNTETSAYVTLEDLAQMVRSDRDFVVFDARTNEDLTHSVLTQIIVEQESRSGGQNLLPVPFLRQLIRFYDDALGKMVPSYLQVSLEMLTKEQERYRTQFANVFGTANPYAANMLGAKAMEFYQEQARKNLQMFEQAMSMWTAFASVKPRQDSTDASASPASAAPGHEPAASRAAEAQRAGAAEPAARPDGNEEIKALKSELAAMQARIERLSLKG